MANYEWAIRHAKRARYYGLNPKCAICGYPGLWAMTKHNGRIICYECNLSIQGKPTTEDHHLLGRQNSPVTVNISGNLHRFLSELHTNWGYDFLLTFPGILIWLLVVFMEYCIRKMVAHEN